MPVVRVAGRAALAGAFLVEFLSEGRYPLLSWLTPAPAWRPLAVAGADVAAVTRGGERRPLVLVHGYAPEGNREERLRAAATLLARTGFAVAVPTVPGLTAGRLRLDDVEPVVATIAALPPPVAVVAVSVGSGPALLAAADPRVRDRLSVVLVLGGYGSARELVRFFLTGDFEYRGHQGHVDHDPAIVRAFVGANGDLLGDPALRPALESRDHARVKRALDDLPGGVQQMLEALSPARALPGLRARLLLVHGRDDRAVPYTESLRLSDARPEGTTLAVVGVVGHVEGESPRAWLAALRDFFRLWRVTYLLLGAR